MNVQVEGSYLLPAAEYRYRKETKNIVVHCSATREQDIGAEDIRCWHVRDNGWLDIGYHFVVRRDGTIERGRPPNAIGSGVNGRNSDSLHICLIGGADAKGRGVNNFTVAQFDSLITLLREAVKAYPGAEVKGHRDFPGVKKDCPSFDVRPWWAAASR